MSEQQAKSARAARRLPLRTVLVMPFVLQIFAAVGLTGYLSLRNGQKAVHELANQLQRETFARVDQHLDTYLAPPRQITELTLDAIDQGLLDLNDLDRSGRYFWKQSQVFSHLSFIGYYLPDNRGAGAGRWFRGQEIVITRHDGRVELTYATDAQGNLTQIVHQTAIYQPNAEDWYASAIQSGKPIWTSVSIEQGFDNYISVTLATPIYNKQRQFLGGIAVDLLLSDMTQFLQQIRVSPTTQIFLLERDGRLLASSKPQSLVLKRQGQIERYSIFNNPDPLQRTIAQNIQDRFQTLNAIQSPQILEAVFQGQRQYVQISPWRDPYGLDWLVIVTVSESDFMEQINANTRTTILLCLGALAIATLIGIYTARWITRPILQLQQKSVALTTTYHQGNAPEELDRTVEANGIREIEALARSFDQMANQIQLAFQRLAQSEQQRFTELAKTNQALRNSLDRLSADPDFNSFLGHVILEITQQLDLHTAWVKLYHPDTQYLQLHLWVEQGTTYLTPNFPDSSLLNSVDCANTIWDQLLQTNQPLVITRETLPRFFSGDALEIQQHWAQQFGMQGAIFLLLILGNEPLGLLALFSTQRTAFTREELELAQAFAQQATLAIALARLAKESRQLAIIRDRNQVAREIHDTLAQGYAGILMQIQAAHFLRQHPDQVQIHLDRASALAREGIADARRSVWLLQQESDAFSDVSVAVRQLVEQISVTATIKPTLTIEGTPFSLRPDIALHILRIIQESLNNALRHAQASAIVLHLNYMPNHLQISIQDNGCGFSLETLSSGFGIRGMQQRAELIGAELQIQSQPNQGTQIELRISLR